MANQVLEIIRQRHRTGSKPGKRTDPYKIGLAVEGGGMRGIVSGGELAVIDALNLKDTFDVVYGSSSGAYNACYFLSGKINDGARIYLDFVNNRNFINFIDVFRRGKFFDLNYLHHQIIHAMPLDWHSVIKSDVPMHIIATDADKTRSMLFRAFKDRRDLLGALYASAYIPPLLKMSPYNWRHHHYLDAGFLDPFGIHSAMQEKCTHLLILFSKPWQHRRQVGLLDRHLMEPGLQQINKHLAELFLHHGEYSVNGLSHIWNHYDGTHILTVAPAAKAKLPSQLTLDRIKLARGYLAGAEAALNTFAPDETSKKYLLQSFKRELKI